MANKPEIIKGDDKEFPQLVSKELNAFQVKKYLSFSLLIKNQALFILILLGITHQKPFLEQEKSGKMQF
ncbi:MAG: hypothetical protein MK105_17455 [Crocinitomicaceae bacterium]|nr:hypothetical protein [Crocinitomicaceae bacterium]